MGATRSVVHHIHSPGRAGENLCWRTVAQALVRARHIVEADPRADPGLSVGHRVIGVQIDLLAFQCKRFADRLLPW